ncbi:MAG: ATP-binding protein [Desulfohalobiaceae bacterium]
MSSNPEVYLQVPAEMAYLPCIGHFAKALFTRYPGLQFREDELAYNLELLVYEACSNVIRHAYPEHEQGKLELKLWLSPQKITMQVLDYGPGFNPQEVPDPDLKNPQIGGMGLYIIKNIADRVVYSSEPETKANILQLEKDL